MGSDEFAIIQPGIDGDGDATTLAERIIEVIRQPYDIDGHKVVVGASVGTAIGRYDAVTADILMCNADLALYHAKLERRGSFRLFTPEIDARVRAQRSLETDLRGALADGQFELNFQPLFGAKRRRVSGFEALMRWHHPQRGSCRPSEFIPAAERIGLIAALGEFALREACTTAARWPEHLRIARQSLTGPVRGSRASESRMPTPWLVRAWRRTVWSSRSPRPCCCRTVRRRAIRCSSSAPSASASPSMTSAPAIRRLSYLLSFPFDKIKIDRSFIEDIVSSSRSQKIVKAVVAMAKRSRHGDHRGRHRD